MDTIVTRKKGTSTAVHLHLHFSRFIFSQITFSVFYLTFSSFSSAYFCFSSTTCSPQTPAADGEFIVLPPPYYPVHVTQANAQGQAYLYAHNLPVI
jgi:hypothetical protein